MQPGEVVLAVAYTGTDVSAVVSTPDGGWMPLNLDGAATLSSAVFFGDDRGVVVGQAAWRSGVAAPERFGTSPVRFLSQDQVSLGGVEVQPVDLVAATLRRTAEAARARLGGTPVGAVGLVVPAAWGPQRRTGTREAALRSGPGAVEMVDAPAAAPPAWTPASRRIWPPWPGYDRTAPDGWAGWQRPARQARHSPGRAEPQVIGSAAPWRRRAPDQPVTAVGISAEYAASGWRRRAPTPRTARTG